MRRRRPYPDDVAPIVGRNVALILLQGGSTLDAARELKLPEDEVRKVAAELRLDLRCPVCGRSRGVTRHTPPRRAATCGDRSCVTTISNWARRGRSRAPFSPEHRANLRAAALQRWARA